MGMLDPASLQDAGDLLSHAAPCLPPVFGAMTRWKEPRHAFAMVTWRSGSRPGLPRRHEFGTGPKPAWQRPVTGRDNCPDRLSISSLILRPPVQISGSRSHLDTDRKKSKIHLHPDHHGYRPSLLPDSQEYHYMRNSWGRHGQPDNNPGACQGGACMADTRHTGGCLCGAIRYETRSSPRFTALCHCRMCQQWSGSAMLGHSCFRPRHSGVHSRHAPGSLVILGLRTRILRDVRQLALHAVTRRVVRLTQSSSWDLGLSTIRKLRHRTFTMVPKASSPGCTATTACRASASILTTRPNRTGCSSRCSTP